MTAANEWGAGVGLEAEVGEVGGGWANYECQECRYKIGNFTSVNQSLPGNHIRSTDSFDLAKKQQSHRNKK